jgi:hypothetical protein
MIHKKAEFDLQSFLITFIFFIGIMVSLGMFASNMITDYRPLKNSTMDSSFDSTYNKLNTIEDRTKTIQEGIVSTDSGTKDASAEFFGDALNSMKLLVPALQVTGTMTDSMASSLGMPDIWFRILSLAVVIMLITVLLFMIFRYR